MIVHLGYDDEEMRGATGDHPDWGAAWRQQDLDMVKSPDFQKFLHDQGFILVGWKDLDKRLGFAPVLNHKFESNFLNALKVF